MAVAGLRKLFVALLFVAIPLSAEAAGWFEKNTWLSGPRYSGRLPACDNSWALSTIQQRFAQKEGRFWYSGLEIVSIDRVRETAYRPWAADAIPRRFCSGLALVSDGVRRPVHYAIGEDLGTIGATWGVTWCVIGLDRNMAYSPACRAARP